MSEPIAPTEPVAPTTSEQAAQVALTAEAISAGLLAGSPTLEGIAAAADITALVTAEDFLSELTSQAAIRASMAVLEKFAEWYTFMAVAEMAGQIGDIVKAFVDNAARFTDGAISQIITGMTGKRFTPPGTGRKSIGRDTPLASSAYGRIADAYRWQQAKIDRADQKAIKDGVPPPELVTPLQAASTRLRQTISSDIQSARRDQAQNTMQKAADAGLIIGWRRAIHPELDSGTVCGLCIAAAARVYHVKVLMPLHPGCHCVPIPVTSKADPTLAANEAALSRVYAEAGGTSREQLRATRFMVDEHGELGPVIRPVGEPIRADNVGGFPHRVSKTEAQRKTAATNKAMDLVKSRDDLEEKIKAAPDEYPQEKWGAVLDRMNSRIRQVFTDIDEPKEADYFGETDNPWPKTLERKTLAQIHDERVGRERFSSVLDERAQTKRTFREWPLLPANKHDLRSDIISANPEFAPANEYSVNCVHAVVAWDMRRRGYDVVATPLPDLLVNQQGRSAHDMIRAVYGNRDFHTSSVQGAANVVDSWPVGSRGFVIVNWKTGGSHIFAVEKTPQGVYWVDPQRGIRIGSHDYTDRSMKKVQIIRVDDMEPNENATTFARVADAQERMLNLRRVAEKDYSGHASQGPLRDINVVEGRTPTPGMTGFAESIIPNYRGLHTAPHRNDYDAPGYAVDRGIFPSDIYDPNVNLRYYGGGGGGFREGDLYDIADRESLAVIQSMRGHPGKMVRIYRALPKGKSGINSGDWVTLSRTYAKIHNDGQLNGKGHIISKIVPAYQLFTDGNSINEFGWDDVPMDDADRAAQKAVVARRKAKAQ